MLFKLPHQVKVELALIRENSIVISSDSTIEKWFESLPWLWKPFRHSRMYDSYGKIIQNMSVLYLKSGTHLTTIINTLFMFYKKQLNHKTILLQKQWILYARGNIGCNLQ